MNMKWKIIFASMLTAWLGVAAAENGDLTPAQRQAALRALAEFKNTPQGKQYTAAIANTQTGNAVTVFTPYQIGPFVATQKITLNCPPPGQSTNPSYNVFIGNPKQKNYHEGSTLILDAQCDANITIPSLNFTNERDRLKIMGNGYIVTVTIPRNSAKNQIETLGSNITLITK